MREAKTAVALRRHRSKLVCAGASMLVFVAAAALLKPKPLLPHPCCKANP